MRKYIESNPEIQAADTGRSLNVSQNKNIQNRLYVATVCSQHRQILEQYDIGVELDQFCTASNMQGEERRNADKEIKELLSMTKRRILHAPFNELFPAAIDPQARELAMRRYNEAAELAIKFGTEKGPKKMVVHSGYMPFVYFKEWHEDRSVEFWSEFMEGKENDFMIVIENVLEDEPYMMAQMMSRITNPNIRLCLDTGHALCMSKIPVTEWLEVMAPYLGHLHIHNNDGSHDFHAPLSDGKLDMEEFLNKAVKLCRNDTTITLETLDGTGSMEWLTARDYLGG